MRWWWSTTSRWPRTDRATSGHWSQAQHAAAMALYQQAAAAGGDGADQGAAGATSGGASAAGDVIDAEVVDEK